MTTEQTPSPLTEAEQKAALEEERKQLEDVKAQLEKAGDRTRAGYREQIKQANERLAYASDMATRALEAQQLVLPHKDVPEHAEKYIQVSCLVDIYTNMKRMMEVDAAVAQKNLASIDPLPALEGEGSPDFPALANPLEDPEYREARVRMDAAVLSFHWRRRLDGIDVVLRASVAPGGAANTAAVNEADRVKRADELKAAMSGDRDLAVTVSSLGADLEETQALMEWANASLQTLGQLPAAAKLSSLDDPDWAKLNGKVHAVIGLGERYQGTPLLAALFPYEEPAVLPYQAKLA